MSLFQTEEINCGACKEPIKIDVVYSVNADRRPDYRDAGHQTDLTRDCGTISRRSANDKEKTRG